MNKNNNVEPRDELIFGKLARSVAISLVALIITYIMRDVPADGSFVQYLDWFFIACAAAFSVFAVISDKRAFILGKVGTVSIVLDVILLAAAVIMNIVM